MNDSTRGADGTILARFFDVVRVNQQVWTFRDEEGHLPVRPRPTREGQMFAVPFWSSRELAEAQAPHFPNTSLIAVPLDLFTENMLVNFEQNNLLMGVDWIGEHGRGFAVPAHGARAILMSEEKVVVSSRSVHQKPTLPESYDSDWSLDSFPELSDVPYHQARYGEFCDYALVPLSMYPRTLKL